MEHSDLDFTNCEGETEDVKAESEHVNCEQRNLPQSYCISFKMASRKRADHSVLKRSIETNTTGMKQAMLAMKTGSPEVTL